MSDQGLSYQTSGVDIEEANRALRGFKDAVRSTFTPEVLSDVGSFGGLFNGAFPGISQPILVSSIDGVGTKTKVAAMVGDYSGLGADIVNHCVNDILVQGAKPLFFLDYFAASKLKSGTVQIVVESAAKACIENGCALLGGETAEMPGVYSEGECDVVGCIVGVVDKSNLLPDIDSISAGDLIIGISSNGLHTNGFSLARKALFEHGKRTPDMLLGSGETLSTALLKSHRSYLNPLSPILKEGKVKALAHLTGGGFTENIPRILGPNHRAVIEKRTWSVPELFQLIQSDGKIAEPEMYRAFNMGIGMVVICASENANTIAKKLNAAGESARIIGEIAEGARGVNLV